MTADLYFPMVVDDMLYPMQNGNEKIAESENQVDDKKASKTSSPIFKKESEAKNGK